MNENFKDALQKRRSFYELTDRSALSDAELEQLLRFAAEHVPSAFNSQTTRLVLLTGEAHRKLWNIVKETLRKIVPAEAFVRTESKIDTSFAAGYGTVLFWEDQQIVRELQEKFPAYAANFPTWSEQTNAMHQLAVWVMLEDAGLGASLQHYNPLIDDEIKTVWQLPEHWKLIAEMPFGLPAGQPGEKTMQPLDERVLVFRQ